jgi:hypothetical protein
MCKNNLNMRCKFPTDEDYQNMKNSILYSDSSLFQYRAISKIVDLYYPQIPIELHLSEPISNDVKFLPLRVIVKCKLFLNLRRALNESKVYKISTFDSNFYKEFYPDLTDMKISSWRHFQIFGSSEGRQTCPHIDLEYMNSQIGNLDGVEITFHELTFNPVNFKLSTSKYISFVAERGGLISEIKCNPLVGKHLSREINQRLLASLLKFDSFSFGTDSKSKIIAKYLLPSDSSSACREEF